MTREKGFSPLQANLRVHLCVNRYFINPINFYRTISLKIRDSLHMAMCF